MGFLDSLLRRAPESRGADDVEEEAPGLFLFDDVPEAIRAEKVLAGVDYHVKLVAPPPRLRSGCDLAVALPRVERPGAERLLIESDVRTTGWADAFDADCRVTDMVTKTDFGQWLMVRTGNMKITVEKETGVIVNTSGGGCPDIPYLNLELVGKRLVDAPRPKDVGYTLCGLMLDRAYLEVARLSDSEAL